MQDEQSISAREITWQSFVLIAIIFTCVEVPLALSLKWPIHVWQIWCDGILSIIFFIDLYLWLSSVEAKKMKITSHVRWMWTLAFYLFCSIPFDLIAWSLELSSWIGVIRLLRCLRIVRVKSLFSLSNGFTLLPTWFKMVAVAITTLIGIHTISCGWMWLNPPPADKTIVDYYVHSVYWAVTTLTTVGYGDVTPTNSLSKIYAMMTMILGVAVFGVVIGNIGRVLAENDRHREKSKEKLQDLMTFMKHYQVPKKLYSETLQYYSTQLGKRLSDNDHQIISDLPQALKHELVTYMNIKLISSLAVFANCSQDCLKEVVKNLESLSFSPNQRIITNGDVGHEMYIINHGNVDIKLPDGKVIASLSEGKFFGEKALIQEAPRNADVVATTYCDLYKLEKANFLSIIKQYPELLSNMENVLNIKKTS